MFTDSSVPGLPSAASVEAFQRFVIGEQELVAVVASLGLSVSEIQQLVTLVMSTEIRTRIAVQRAGAEVPGASRVSLQTLQSFDLALFDALKWLIDTGQTVSVVCAKFGFRTRERRRLMVLLADYHERLSRALARLHGMAGEGHGHRLRNSQDVPPVWVLSPAERMRLARNHLHIARLKGAQLPKLKKLMRQFGLTVDEALTVMGRGKNKEFTK